MMKRYLFFVSVVLLVHLFAETSAFDAGSLDSDNPYGLTESEKIIFENKKKIGFQEQKISELSEEIEGMRSVIDSISIKLGKTGQRISELDKQSSSISDSQIEQIKSEIKELKDNQAENFEKINSVLKKLSKMIDKINSDYVTHQELNSVGVKKKSTKHSSIKNSTKRSKLSNSQKLKDAVALFRKNYYTKAMPIFKELADKSYKPATTNYYLGEISYYKKRFSDAIVYYKKSVGYYDKASYMPTLLLHTGISFENLNDYENRDKFLNALINSYPNSQEAKIAKEHLD